MVIYMYIAPGWGQMSPWGPIFFRIINIKSYCPFPISCKTFTLNDILKVFPIQISPDTLKHTPFIYLVIEKRDPFIYHAFKKSDPFIYLIVQNFDLYTIINKYFDFLSCVCQQKSALKHGCPKNLVIHRLNGAIHIF